jgi:serine/threonine protein phosphatase PrpC
MRFGKTPALKTAAITHAGMSGKNNEDRFRILRLITPKRQEAVLAVVADGIGGHHAGEVAAELASEQIVRSIEAQSLDQPVQALRQAILDANQVVLASAQSNPHWGGMGSTCACAFVIGNRLYTASVGDTRIYLIRGKQIFQLSRDHTWIQEAIDLGTLPAATAHLHPNAHVIRRYIGAPYGVQPDTRLYLQGNETDQQAEANQGIKLKPGDRIVVCSDGLTDLVASHEILAILKKRPLEQALQELVSLANRRGGHDNITIVALQVGQTSSRMSRWLAAATLSTLLTSGLIAAIWLFYLSDSNQILHRLGSHPTPSASPPTLLEETPPFFSPVATEEPLSPIASGSPTLTVVPSSTPIPSLPPTATFTPWPTNTPQP